MKTVLRKKHKMVSSSWIELMIRDIMESFTRKTDSEKRAALFGVDPFKN